MGTSNRSKAFHDVAWKNLGDAGFPDRILWHKAVAAKYPVLRHHAASASTAHRPADRTRSAACSSIRSSTTPPCRPPAATTTGWTRSGGTSSGWDGRSVRSTPLRRTSTTPSRLQGNVLLVVGELDTNVDPSSTMQVVNQLIKHDKDFDLLYIPGAGHGPAAHGRAQAVRLLRAPSARDGSRLIGRTAIARPRHRIRTRTRIGRDHTP